jgi:hypothetical protein
LATETHARAPAGLHQCVYRLDIQSDNGAHGTFVFQRFPVHQFAPLEHQAKGIGHCDHLCGSQRTVFAQAVAGGKSAGDSGLLNGFQTSQVDGRDGRLQVDGFRQGFHRAFKAVLGNMGPGNIIGSIENFPEQSHIPEIGLGPCPLFESPVREIRMQFFSMLFLQIEEFSRQV